MPLYHLMEDAATAEISRTQVWQWVHNPKGVLADGRRVSLSLVRELIQEESGRIRAERGDERFANGRFADATRLFDELVANETLTSSSPSKRMNCSTERFVGPWPTAKDAVVGGTTLARSTQSQTHLKQPVVSA